jgi:hypothetical protein
LGVKAERGAGDALSLGIIQDCFRDLSVPHLWAQVLKGAEAPKTHVVGWGFFNGSVVELLEVDVELDGSLPAGGSDYGLHPWDGDFAWTHTHRHAQTHAHTHTDTHRPKQT